MTPDLEAARALHDEVVAIDLHADTLKLAAVGRYDIAARHKPLFPNGAYLGHVDLPRAAAGGLGGQVFTMWTVPYPERGCAHGIHKQIDALDALVARTPDAVSKCLTADDVREASRAGRFAALLGIEGGHALEGRLENVEAFHRRGVRTLGLLHFSASDIGYPAAGWGRDDTKGLTKFGAEVVEEMSRLGMILDLAHINRRGYFEALALYDGVPMVTHAGVVGVREHWRNLTDAQIRALADRGGVLGVIFAPIYLGGTSLDVVCEHIEHIVKIAGEDVPALGSDYDGMIVPTVGLEDISNLPRLTAALLARGMSRRTVKKILGENVMRVLAENPPRA